MRTTIFSLLLFFLFTGVYSNTMRVNDEDIPEKVNATLEEEFSDYLVVDFKLIETKTGKFYEFELEGTETENVLKVLIDLEGNVIKKEAKKIEKQEERDVDVNTDANTNE